MFHTVCFMAGGAACRGRSCSASAAATAAVWQHAVWPLHTATVTWHEWDLYFVHEMCRCRCTQVYTACGLLHHFALLCLHGEAWPQQLDGAHSPHAACLARILPGSTLCSAAVQDKAWCTPEPWRLPARGLAGYLGPGRWPVLCCSIVLQYAAVQGTSYGRHCSLVRPVQTPSACQSRSPVGAAECACVLEMS